MGRGALKKENVILKLLNLFYFFLNCKCFNSTKILHIYFPEMYKREFSETFSRGQLKLSKGPLKLKDLYYRNYFVKK